MKTPQFMPRTLQFARTLGKGRGPLRTARARYPRIRLKQAPEGRSGMQDRWVPARAGRPAVAGDVHEAGAARRYPRPAGGQVVPGDRLAGGGEPLLPLTGAGWFPAGV